MCECAEGDALEEMSGGGEPRRFPLGKYSRFAWDVKGVFTTFTCHIFLL